MTENCKSEFAMEDVNSVLNTITRLGNNGFSVESKSSSKLTNRSAMSEIPEIKMGVMTLDGFHWLGDDETQIEIGVNSTVVLGISLKSIPVTNSIIDLVLDLVQSNNANTPLEAHALNGEPSSSGITVDYNVIDYSVIEEIDGVKHHKLQLKMLSCGNRNEYVYIALNPLNNSESISVYSTMATLDKVPTLIKTYIDCGKNQKFVSAFVGSTGTLEVNVRNCTAKYTESLFSLGGNKMPLNINICYNSLQCDASTVGFESFTHSTYMPKSWKLNYQQYVFKRGASYFYIDGNYSTFEFVKAENSDAIYYEKDGFGLKLESISNGFTISDGKSVKLEFNSSGILEKIVSIGGSVEFSNTIMTYNSEGKLEKITDGMGRSANITYDTDKITINIADCGSVVIKIDSDGNLIGIIGRNGFENTYTYLNVGCLSSIHSYNGEQIDICYLTDKTVASYTEFVNKGVSIPIFYTEFFRYYLQTHIYTTKNSAERSNNSIHTVYNFNANGQFVGSNEYVDNKIINISTQNDDDYEHYTLKTTGILPFAQYDENGNTSFSLIGNGTAKKIFRVHFLWLITARIIYLYAAM